MKAYCGLECSRCPAYLATQADDDKMRLDCVRKWDPSAALKIGPEQINCDGCKDGRTLFFFCSACPVRECAVGRGVQACTTCPEYICDNMERLMAFAPSVRRDKRR